MHQQPAKPHMIINTIVLSRLTHHHKWTRSHRVSISYFYSKLKLHGISVVGDTNVMEVQTSQSFNVAPSHSITHTSIPHLPEYISSASNETPLLSIVQVACLWHDGDPPCMDRTQVYILKHSDAECFHRFLNSQQRSRLKTCCIETWIGIWLI